MVGRTFPVLPRSGRTAPGTGGHPSSTNMPSYDISVSATIDAPAPVLYGVIADYRGGHQEILPRPPFVSLDVEEGGTGAGTVMRVAMRFFGRTETFRSVVSEPEPGRVLVETNDTGYVTTFTVEPRGDGDGRTEVTISTDMSRLSGLRGALERRVARRLLPPVYRRELELLAEVTRRMGPA